MAVEITVQRVEPRRLAAVRREVPIRGVAGAWRPALDQVWAFLRSQPGLHMGGHNVFLYRHPSDRNLPMQVDFGVEVARSFGPSGEVREIYTPTGEAAVAIHRGPYDQLGSTHDAIHRWVRERQRTLVGYSWEIYGDWTEDAALLETTVVYSLR